MGSDTPQTASLDFEVHVTVGAQELSQLLMDPPPGPDGGHACRTTPRPENERIWSHGEKSPHSRPIPLFVPPVAHAGFPNSCDASNQPAQ